MRHNASTVIVVMGLVLAACGSTSSEPISTYDGAECAYDGPSEFDLDAVVTFTFINATDEPEVGFSVWTVPDGATAAEILEKGIFAVAGEDRSYYTRFVSRPTAKDREYALNITLDTPGPHSIICFDLATGVDHPILFAVSDG